MIYDREYIEKFVARSVRPRRPDLEATLLEVFDSLESGAVITQQNLTALVEAASDRSAGVYEIAAELLGEVAERDSKALQAICAMSRSPLAYVRRNAVLCLTTETSPAIRAQILRAGLEDKSKLVRQKAADWIQRLLLKETASDISNALRVETDGSTAVVMRGTLQALRRGRANAA